MSARVIGQEAGGGLVASRPHPERCANTAPAVRLRVQPLRDDYIRADTVDLMLVLEQLCRPKLGGYPRRTMPTHEFAACGGKTTSHSPRRSLTHLTGARLVS